MCKPGEVNKGSDSQPEQVTVVKMYRSEESGSKSANLGLTSLPVQRSYTCSCLGTELERSRLTPLRWVQLQ
jgi:hypothetical protein